MSEYDNAIEISEDQVGDYLRTHPDFFHQRDDLLLKMQIPHQRGEAISLVERQVNVLRERNLEMRQRLNHLLDVARDNDRLFDKTRRLVLALLEARHLDDVVSATEESLRNDFQVPYCELILFSDKALNTHGRVTSVADASQKLAELLRNNRAVSGLLRDSELNFLFPGQRKEIGSSAVVPLQFSGRVLGVLAIASPDEQQYRSSVGTLFLSYVGDVLSRLLPGHIDTQG
ncbi:DUF484 family protein [Aestuariirhabdus litorea]|uniref:DUF484 family protein n=1 Tax=Aestuariirhabdus litorea TaxID=2528527 RepID=A0A3P3VKP6_9GAMM|nr:DUF484 family protein [Aestuariirhabdus litorea]RRJ82954.1 DUF484 family protein [Aestuariirhabdus litorea]RWW93113.1 DUF484 family protein [Endozoicomonadaceae bacterium GTF-13]